MGYAHNQSINTEATFSPDFSSHSEMSCYGRETKSTIDTEFKAIAKHRYWLQKERARLEYNASECPEVSSPTSFDKCTVHSESKEEKDTSTNAQYEHSDSTSYGLDCEETHVHLLNDYVKGSSTDQEWGTTYDCLTDFSEAENDSESEEDDLKGLAFISDYEP